MPRIRQNKELYAVADFSKEIRLRQAEYDIRSKRKLAELSGIPNTSLCAMLDDPMLMRVSNAKAIIKVLHPDPGIILRLLGYTPQEIRKFKGV